MIGKVEWDWVIEGLDEPVRVAMVLGDDLAFRSDQMPSYAAGLTGRLREEYSTSDGHPGVKFLRELAREHGGIATVMPPPPASPGVVY